MSLIGKTLALCEITSQLGKGSIGEVSKTRETHPGRIVAITKIREQHSERFRQKARAVSGESVKGDLHSK